MANLAYRSLPLWLLGYPDAARKDNEYSVNEARETGHATSLILALTYMSLNDVFSRRDYATAKATTDELVALSDEKGALFWKASGILLHGQLCAVEGKATEAVEAITFSLAAIRSTGTKMFVPYYLAYLAIAYADIGQFDEAWRCIDDAVSAVKTTKESWWEAEINRVAGEIILKSSQPDATKAETYFERAVAVARQQQAKSPELRAAMSLAHLWHFQGKVQQARELLAPVYGWFTEGFDTRDLKEAKALLAGLASELR